ncbi:MFS transporter-21 [Coleophoma cylindrospora]|uniref:MFS transporter-21 n=1 Tax=Coleophoma cylindrospora TaxID=1849047 RepID=A0A3D8QPH5_9HELO|nr:MFS transporter-21 [Coleophoma cylindrospora]
MAFGILESSNNARPTGTTLLEDLHANGAQVKAEVILVPQPSSSPADPLNMSRLRKELLFATIIFGACVTGVVGPLLVPGFSIIAADFNITLTQVTYLNGVLLMGLGISSYLCSCFAQIYGKRLVYLFTTVLCIAACCWGAAAKSYHSLLAARFFQGLGMGGFFALAGTGSISDVFFVHERGFRVGIWNFAVIVSVNMTPIISGYVITNLSWQWSFWILALTFGVLLVMVVCLFPETTFERETTTEEPIRTLHHTEVNTVPYTPGEKETASDADNENEDSAVGQLIEPAKFNLSRDLGLGSLKIHDQLRIFEMCVTPIMLLRHPGVIWAAAMWSVTFTWVIIQGAVADQIFEAPPYNMSAIQVGNLVGIAPLIGSALGTLVSGPLSDWLALFMAKRNNGIYEPEFRLFLVIPSLISIIIGAFGLASGIQNGTSAIVCGVFLAIINFSVGVGCTGIVSYSNDVFKQNPGGVFGVVMLIKSIFAFGLTFMFNNYYTTHGPLKFFSLFGGLTTGVMLTTIPIYIYGKKIRDWSDRKGLLEATAW